MLGQRKKQLKTSYLKQTVKVLGFLVLGLLLISSQTQLIGAFEGQVVNVKAEVHQLDDPVFYPKGKTFCTMDEGVDVISIDPDDAPVVV